MKPRLSPPASHCVRRPALALILAIGLGSAGVFGQDPVAAPALGATAQALIEHARQGNPGFAAARAEASAARERVTPAGALPDPRFELELMDATNTMSGRSASLLPGQVGETRYRITQPLPGWGKRDLAVKAAEAQVTQADEFMIVSDLFDPALRLRSLTIAAEAMAAHPETADAA